MHLKIGPPNPDDISALAVHVNRVGQLAIAHLGKQLSGGEEDLDILQSLLDAGFVGPADTYDLHCMGILFGTLVVDALDDVDWAMAEDDDGRDPAIRYADTTLLVFPMTMISKRVEDGEVVDVRELFVLICRELDQLKPEVLSRH